MATAMDDHSRVLTLTEVAAYLRISRMTAYRYCRSGALPCFRVGSEYRFLLDEVERWITQQTQGTRNNETPSS